MSNYFAALDVEDEEVVAKGKGDAKKAAPAKPVVGAAPAKPVAASAPRAAAGAVGIDASEAPADRARRAGAPPKGEGRKADRVREGFSGRGREFDRHVSGNGVRKGDAPKAGAAPSGAKDLEESAAAGADGAAPAEGEAAAAATEEVAPEEVDTSLTLEDVEKARAAKRTGALFAVAAEDKSSLVKNLGGLKSFDRKPTPTFFGKSSKVVKAEESEEEEEEAADELNLKELLAFRIGTAPAPRGDRPAGPRGPRSDRPPRAEGERSERAPRGDRPPRAEGERAPRGDRPPRAEGDRPRGPPRGDRAPRGAPRGGAGAASGAPRASAPRGAVNVKSTTDFPALGH